MAFFLIILIAVLLNFLASWILPSFCMAVIGALIGQIIIRHDRSEIISFCLMLVVAVFFVDVINGFHKTDWEMYVLDLSAIYLGILFIVGKKYWKEKQFSLNEQVVTRETCEDRGMSDQAIKSNPIQGKYILLGISISTIIYILSAIVLDSGPEPEKGLTVEEASHLKYRVRLENINFDIPVLYNYTTYSISGRWPRPTQGELDDRSRRKVNNIWIEVLLPDMDIYDKSNAAEFEVLGHGKRLRITVQKLRKKWPYYFNNAFKRLIPLDKSTLVPNMIRYRDPQSIYSDVYFNSINPDETITKIRCYAPENPVINKTMTSPNCTVDTVYNDQVEVSYTFSLDFLPRWKEIDKKVRVLLDSFVDSTNAPFK